MTTRISNGGPAPNVDVSATATRVTPQPTTPFRSVFNATTSAVLSGAEATVRTLPGGEVLAAAVRTGSAGDLALQGNAGGVRGGTMGGSALPTDPAASGAASGGSVGIESALAQQSQDTLYYLSLQQRMQDENRYYTTMSNTLKARHDTVKNSISNLR